MRLPRILVLGVALAAITLTACTSEAQQPEQPVGSNQPGGPAARGVSGRAVKVALQPWAPTTAGSRRSPTMPVRRPTSLGSSYCFLRAPTTRLPRSPRSRRSSTRSRTCW